MITRLVRTIQVMVLLCGALVLENLGLRQRLGMHQRSRPKPAVRRTDRWFWVLIRPDGATFQAQSGPLSACQQQSCGYMIRAHP
jgi:hypothetical protein